MTHQQRIKAIRAQMTAALKAGKMGEYLQLLEGLSMVLMAQAQRVEIRAEHDAHRGGL
jgi:hypothetical protein